MAVRPLTVAAIAAVLLALSVGTDLALNRTYALDVQKDGGWVQIAQQPYYYDDHEMRPFLSRESPILEVNQTDQVTLRLRAENEHPFRLSETYRVYVAGLQVASGELEASAFDQGEAVFTVDARALLGEHAVGPIKEAGSILHPSIEVRIGDEFMYATLRLKEVSR